MSLLTILSQWATRQRAPAWIFHTVAGCRRGQRLVAQVSNLLYRRLPVGSKSKGEVALAGWKPAIQQVGNLRYGVGLPSVYEISGLGLTGVLLSLALTAEGAGAQAVTAPSTSQPTRHSFACTDYSQGKVFVVSSTGDIEWEYPGPSANDLWVLPGGNLLFNTGHGVKEVTRDRRVVFDYQSRSEIYACQRLTNGLTFIGECNSGRLLEVDPSGRVVKEVRLLPEGKDGGHLYMRNARRLENGHYLVAHYGDQVVREYDAEGKVVLSIAAEGGPHSVARLPGGHTLISCGDRPGGPRIFETDTTGKTVWQVKGDELPGVSLKFVAGFQRLPNGNTVICNWLGHGQLGKAPHIVEITSDKRVVWTFADHQHMQTVSNVQLLDLESEAKAGGTGH